MRITAGGMRGRTMSVPDIQGLRPTSSRVREALFNIVGDMNGMTMLDLFAGSGVMSLEALSRGAARVVSIEGSLPACRAMEKIRESWSVTDWTVDNGMLPQRLPAGQYFDLIFADPPYGQEISQNLPVWLAEKKVSYGMLVIEEASRAKVSWQGRFYPFKQRKYGESTLYFFEQVAE